MPFIARWPARIKPKTSDALIGQIDLLASFAALTGQKLAADAGPGQLQRAAGAAGRIGEGPRPHRGTRECAGDPQRAVEAHPGEGRARRRGALRSVDGSRETKNLAAERPEVVRELSAMLDQIRDRGRSRP